MEDVETTFRVSNGSRKRVRFSDHETVHEAVEPAAREAGSSRTLLPEPDEGEFEAGMHSRRGGDDSDGPIKGTDPGLAAAVRARHRKEIDSLKAGEQLDISLLEDVAAAEEEYFEDLDERFRDSGVPIEPFNLRSERETGYFDPDGHFLQYRQDEETDAWLETLEDDNQAGPSTAAEDASAEPDGAAIAPQEEELSEADLRGFKRRVVALLQSGETVLEALRRLGAPSGQPLPPTEKPGSEDGGKRSGAKVAAARARVGRTVPEANSAAFNSLTEDASLLLAAGDTGIYTSTSEELQADLRASQAAAEARLPPQALETIQAVMRGTQPATSDVPMEHNGSTTAGIGEVDMQDADAEAEPQPAQLAADPDADIFADASAAMPASMPDEPGSASTAPDDEHASEASRLTANATSAAQSGQPNSAVSVSAEGVSGGEASTGAHAGAGKDSREGFDFDKSSGLWYNSTLGCFFDESRQLYGDAASGQWYKYSDGNYQLVSL